MKKFTIYYVIVFVLSILVSTLFNSFVPDFKFKQLVVAAIMIIPILAYAFIYSKAKQRIQQVSIDKLKEYVGALNPDTNDPFEKVIYDYATKKFSDYFRYMHIEEDQVFGMEDQVKLIVSGVYNVLVKEKKLNITILFEQDKISVGMKNKFVNEEFTVNYPKKQTYKELEKEIYSKISSL